MQLEYLNYLNYEQKQAVNHTNGPLFVVAGAGTGKTMTITAKVAYLIHQGMKPERILALTFTNKAAKEMRERIIEMVGPAANMASLSTFHSFGLRFLRKHISILENGLDEAFVVVDEEDAKSIIKDLIKQLGFEEETFDGKNIYNQVFALKVGYHKFYLKTDELELLTTEYNKYLKKNNLVDFDDLILYTKKILESEETIRTYYQQHYEYILVDEFQDSDHQQYNILKLLVNEHKNITVVGDPDQSIYSFRGARYANNSLFVSEFNADIITLSKNYRSTNYILGAANSLINTNINRYPAYENKFLQSDLGNGEKPKFLEFNRDIDENLFIANQIKELKSFYGVKPNQIVVLYRSSYLSRAIEEVLIRNQIPYVVYGGISFFQRKQIKDMLAYIRLSLNQNQDFFLKRIINIPKRKIGKVTVEKLEYFSNQKYKSMFNSIPTFEIAESTKTELMKFYSMINKFKNYIDEGIELKELIDKILKESGYKEMLLAEGLEGIERIQEILELKGIFTRGEILYEGTTKEKLIKILDEIALMTDVDKNIATEDKVIISTYHQVKGLEFQAVFMTAMEENIFPSPLTFEEVDAVEEERRIAYVGITRAKKYLYLTNSRRRFRFGKTEQNVQSRFIEETKRKNVGIYVDSTDVRDVSFGFIDTGDKVEHETFGLGKVITVDNDIATIAFKAEYGIKKIIIGHPSLKKID